MPEDQKKTYIGVKRIEAYPEDRDGKPGYAVIYPDGYKSWSPKAVFEAAYFPIEKANSLTQNDIDRMIEAGEVFIDTIGEKTTLVRVVLPTGFKLFFHLQNNLHGKNKRPPVEPDGHHSPVGAQGSESQGGIAK